MPYVSDKQRRFFNSPTGIAKLGAEKVDEFNKASKGMKLPDAAADNESPDTPELSNRYTHRMKGY